MESILRNIFSKNPNYHIRDSSVGIGSGESKLDLGGTYTIYSYDRPIGSPQLSSQSIHHFFTFYLLFCSLS